jgi:hypothetical protein
MALVFDRIALLRDQFLARRKLGIQNGSFGVFTTVILTITFVASKEVAKLIAIFSGADTILGRGKIPAYITALGLRSNPFVGCISLKMDSPVARRVSVFLAVVEILTGDKD